MKADIEKRKYPRVKLTGYTANIAGESFVYSGVVQDASFEGIQLSDLPKRFSAVKGERFSVIVSSFFDSTHYKLTVHSQWRRKSDIYVAVGFNVVNAPASWKTFIRQALPEQQNETEEEVWDKYLSAKV